MRLPSFPTIARTFYLFGNATTRRLPTALRHPALSTPTILRSIPTIPFLGALFGTSTRNNMSYPVQKTDDEWQAVLSPGTFN